MRKTNARGIGANGILSRLGKADLALLQPHLQPMELPVRTFLEQRNRKIENVYFIESGFASVVAEAATKSSLELGMIGREGMTGRSVVLGVEEKAPNNIYMQASGSGFAVKANVLQTLFNQSPTLHRSCLGFTHEFMLQLENAVIANAAARIDERLARWLLMASDRVGPDLRMTHACLSQMLGVYRPGVTTALQGLEAASLIETARGVISIVNRPGLIRRANGAYAGPSPGIANGRP